MCQADDTQELPVTFRPELYLQRRGWVLDIMRREGITEVLDIGCGEGELLSCLCNPAPWLAPPPPDVLPAIEEDGVRTPHEVVAEGLHKDILHPVRIAGLDVSRADLECAVEGTRPRASGSGASTLWRDPARWEPLEAKIWEGSLAVVNPEFVGVECIVSTEVIEHLPEDILQAFAPTIFGAYHPRIVLLTTPSYTFNARFTAPDAPIAARSGWPDPTRRTSRIFRHYDHKFEWTVDEFAQWCHSVAEEWGYDVEIGGVGKAQEVDEWGRDEALGWASQVAAFRRREGPEWEERRARKVDELGILPRTTAQGEHQLLATHHHPPHEAARHPQPLDAVGELVVAKMVQFREASVPLRELWFDDAVAVACGGWVDWLICAIRQYDGLCLDKGASGYSEELVVRLEPCLQDLIPSAAQASPPDTDEVGDPWDAFDDDDDDDDVRVATDETYGEEGGWGEPDIEWDREAVAKFNAETRWGDPQEDWSCSSEWT
ncbi:hypothetical protein GY45DRAFT_1310137 [Cubamyces sp. BRFM 1775]|nr:hypothetical protein GY45DRAFT_1310137 [Cubamyces sp. BRFM 1775]